MKDHSSSEQEAQSMPCPGSPRNRFFKHKRMTAALARTEQRYFIERRRLITRSVLGWGVVGGLPVSVPDGNVAPTSASQGALPTKPVGTLSVGEGLALDRHGREIVVTAPTVLNAKNTFLRSGDASDCRMASLDDLAPGHYLLAAHYAERRLGDVDVRGGCDCDEPEKELTCETVAFSLTCITECRCGEPPCDRVCRCGASSRCGESGRGPHACMCHWLSGSPLPGRDRLCEWNGQWVDPADGVDLACVYVTPPTDHCQRGVPGSVDDACSPRRFVKGNDLLYDLQRGCDLTRIESLSWGEWHRRKDEMPWNTFIDFLGPDPVPSSQDPVPRLTKFSVAFTGPVRSATVTPDCFSLRFTVTHPDTGWFETRAVAIPEVRPAPPTSGDPADTTRSVTLCVDQEWYVEVSQRANKFKYEGATVSIEVHGDYILDCHGQAVDANARGFALQASGGSIESSGNGTPGGTLLSVFRIPKRS